VATQALRKIKREPQTRFFEISGFTQISPDNAAPVAGPPAMIKVAKNRLADMASLYLGAVVHH
jgi:hypothetical protein